MNVTSPQIVFGYHGCVSQVAERILSGQDEDLEKTAAAETYHWLGEGIYFWENAADRAAEWALLHGAKNARKKHPEWEEEGYVPTVLGAIIRLGTCLNLLDIGGHKALRRAAKKVLPDIIGLGLAEKNEAWRHTYDCLVINKACTARRGKIDTVRGCFPEGAPIYEGSYIKEKTHVQISVRNPDCIIGYFRPKNVQALIAEARRRLKKSKA